MKPIAVRGYTITIKLSMVMIIVAFLFGISSLFVLNAYPKVVDRMPSYGYLAPTAWKCEFRAPAVASVDASSTYNTNGGFDTKKDGAHSHYRIDMDNGVTVKIDKVGPTPDHIYLRNGLHIAQLREQGAANLTFEAKASDPHPILLTIRDNGRLLWRQEVKLTDTWETYRMTVDPKSIEEANKLFVIFSVQIGSKKGTVSLRNIHLK